MPNQKFERHGFEGNADRLLRERLEREEMGDEAYERMIAHYDDRAFKKFGIVFIVGFGVIALGIAWLGY